ncbi:sulfurtransferase complex subunit TusD [Methylococcus geothermalis]|uniref:Sulfurtransferase complex subunit TusD n=1 Tax=Methylococcus geothermalis TaxID=2681310 RepID=A0A858Q8D4_9GAMM|nr:sulfurtransferase complex subunit TusD [Methylococcus geothermalis]QJD30087.1 sulfurtransferase complex subunit TusD [Methylococcus geothermalis]
MKFVIQINASPREAQAANTAYQFIKAALANGHAILLVFFYYDGVCNAQVSSFAGEDDPAARWSSLAREHGLDLVLCVSAAQRRGLVSTEGRDEGYLAPGFRVGGLGQWVDACLKAERALTFAA